MTKPISDKAEVALDYPDKFYSDAFERSLSPLRSTRVKFMDNDSFCYGRGISAKPMPGTPPGQTEALTWAFGGRD